MPNYGGTSSGMDDLDTWGGGSVGNFGSGGYDMGGNADFGGYTSFGDWGGSSVDDQIADAVAGVAAASLAGGDAGGWASPSGGFGTVDVSGGWGYDGGGGIGIDAGGWDYGGLGDALGGADGWGSSVSDMVGGGWGDALGGGGADMSGGFGSSVAGSIGGTVAGIGASGFGSGGGGGGGWDVTPQGDAMAASGFSDLFTDAGRQPNMGQGMTDMNQSAFGAASIQDMQSFANAVRGMNAPGSIAGSQLPAGVTSQPGTPNMYGTPQELGPKIQDRISPDIANALPAPAGVMEPSNPALAGFSYGQQKPDKIQDRIDPDKDFQNPNYAPVGRIDAAVPGAPVTKDQSRISPDPDPLKGHATNKVFGFVDTSMGSVLGVGKPQKDQSRIGGGGIGGYASIAAGGGAGLGGTATIDVGSGRGSRQDMPSLPQQDIASPSQQKPSQQVFGAPTNLLGNVVSRTGTPVTDRYGSPVKTASASDRYGNALDVGWPSAEGVVYTDGYVAPQLPAVSNTDNEDSTQTEQYPTHAYPPYYPTWPYVSGYAPGGLAPWSWFQSLYAQS